MRIRNLLLLLSAFTFVGCQSSMNTSTVLISNQSQSIGAANKSLAEAMPCCDSFASLPFESLPLDQTVVKTLDSNSPAFLFESGKSFVIGYELPETNRPFDIEISSIAAEDRVFSPSVTMLDSHFNITRTFGQDAFAYKSADLINGERLQSNLVDIGGFKDERYLVIYTTDQQRMGTTTMVHPAKQFAIATNRVAPDIADPVAQHSSMGIISIYASIPGKSTPSAESIVKVPAAANISPEDQANELITKAVAEGNIEEALRLVEDAEANGSKTARPTFIQAVKKQ